MGTCPKCHRWKKKGILIRHVRMCIPGKQDLDQYFRSKGSSMSKHKTGPKGSTA